MDQQPTEMWMTSACNPLMGLLDQKSISSMFNLYGMLDKALDYDSIHRCLLNQGNYLVHE